MGVAAPVLARVLINEFDYDQPSTDTAEFIELKNTGPLAVNLQSFSLDLINGRDGGMALYRQIVLPAVALPAGAYYIVCANPATVPNCDLDADPDTNLIQNGAPDAIALFHANALIDTVSYEGDTAGPYTEGSGVGLRDNPDKVEYSLSRLPDGFDSDQNNVDFVGQPRTPGWDNEASFFDVPSDYWAFEAIEAMLIAGITSGCGNHRYCPLAALTRAQMAVFLLRAIHGGGYTPPAATGTLFDDVPSGSFAAAWIEQLALEGITSGCGSGNYCPQASLTRAQMAVFLLRGIHGSAYTPPPATGVMFADIPKHGFAAAWIERLALEGITGGCGAGNFCPNRALTRDQMAVFLQRAFDL